MGGRPGAVSLEQRQRRPLREEQRGPRACRRGDPGARASRRDGAEAAVGGGLASTLRGWGEPDGTRTPLEAAADICSGRWWTTRARTRAGTNLWDLGAGAAGAHELPVCKLNRQSMLLLAL